MCVSMLQRRALEDLVGARLSQHFEVERNIKGRGTMSGRQSKSSTPATSRPRSMQEARKSVKRSSSSRKAIRDNREEDVYKPDLSLVDNIIESRNSRIRSENKQHRLKSREKSTSKSRRQHRRHRERIEKLNALINNDKLQLRVPLMPLEEPAENAPFLWMTLTDDQKKKAENKYFTLKELKRRLRSKERKRKAKLTNREKKKTSGKRLSSTSAKKMKKKLKLKDSVFLRPITPTPPLKGLSDLSGIESITGNAEALSDSQSAAINTTLILEKQPPGSRPNTRGSDAIFNEFKHLLEVAEHSDLDLRYKKFVEQFRGGNPYIKTLRNVVEKGFREADEDEAGDAKSPYKNSEHLDKSLPYCRRCKINVTFETEKQCLQACPVCGALVNKKDHMRFIKHQLHLKHEKERLGRLAFGKKESIRPTFGEIVKSRYNKKIRLNFVDDMNDICRYLAKRQFAGKPLGENVWKKFDVAQARLKNNLRE